MIFLIQYDRRKGAIVKFERFSDSERHDAENLRLKVELDLRRKAIDREVVLLEADSEEALRRTHRRYFEDVNQLATSSSAIITQ